VSAASLTHLTHPIAEHAYGLTRNWIVRVLDWLYVSFHSAVEAGVTDMLEGYVTFA